MSPAQTPIPHHHHHLHLLLLLPPHPIFQMHSSQRLPALNNLSSPILPKSMDSSPASPTKSSSRLARTNSQEPPPPLSLDLVSYNTLSPKPQNPISVRDLLLLSPSPARKSRTRLDICEDVSEPHGSRRRCKNRFANVGSPRNSRRSRRRMEQEVREDKDLISCVDELVVGNNKVKKRRQSGRSKKDKSVSCPSIPSPKPIDDDDDDYGYDFHRLGLLITDLIMWNDVAKSTLWFGLGSLCFVSSCFTTGVSLSMLSLVSQLGLLCLVVSFFSNTIAQRNGIESKRELKLKEDDILRAARVILPALNFAISKARKLFSGQPTMTLKVAPWLLLGSKYGHIVTFTRLCALGFFIGFTGPKLWSLYSIQICKKGECLKAWLMEAWGGCSHKKIVAASAITGFWNLTSIQTRIFAAFICLVLFRWYRQELILKLESEEESQQQEKTLTLVENMKID